MDNSQKNEVYKIDENLAKTIINKNFYFSAHGAKSEFSELPGHYQRAIEKEAAFQVKTLAQTEGFADILTKDNMKEAEELHNAICEYYAHKGNLDEKLHPNYERNLFSVLLKRDSENIYHDSFVAMLNSNNDSRAQDFFANHNKESVYDKTSRRAKHFNEHIAERKAKGINRDPSVTIKNIYEHVRGNIR